MSTPETKQRVKSTIFALMVKIGNHNFCVTTCFGNFLTRQRFCAELLRENCQNLHRAKTMEGGDETHRE